MTQNRCKNLANHSRIPKSYIYVICFEYPSETYPRDGKIFKMQLFFSKGACDNQNFARFLGRFCWKLEFFEKRFTPRPVDDEL